MPGAAQPRAGSGGPNLRRAAGRAPTCVRPPRGRRPAPRPVAVSPAAVTAAGSPFGVPPVGPVPTAPARAGGRRRAARGRAAKGPFGTTAGTAAGRHGVYPGTADAPGALDGMVYLRPVLTFTNLSTGCVRMPS
jgi:hypothetical protein